MNVELRKTFQFEAAHSLPNLPENHKCHRLHGHSFKVDVVMAGECDERLGWLMDYSEIGEAFDRVEDLLPRIMDGEFNEAMNVLNRRNKDEGND